MAFQALLSCGTDAAHAAHGKRIEEHALGSRIDDGEAAGLVHIGSDLRNRSRSPPLPSTLRQAARPAAGCAYPRQRGALLVRVGVTSRKASSMLTCCTSGVSSFKMDMTWLLTCLYRSNLPAAQMAWGQSLRRCRGHGGTNAEYSRFIGRRDTTPCLSAPRR